MGEGGVGESSGKDDEESQSVEELSPCGRWCRYAATNSALVAKGSFKLVMKGFDMQRGMEVAWNIVNPVHTMSVQDAAEIESLMREFHVMKTLVNPHIVRCYGGWRNEETGTINFITELFTSGSLRTYRWKHKDLDTGLALNKWGRNILSGLQFLHTQTPPIVHRDLRCDYCYINGNTGEVKIADLGRATFMRQNTSEGTSTLRDFVYMAPEMYHGDVDTPVDIYAFGMLLLELVTLERPYAEFKNAPLLLKALEKGELPEAVELVRDIDLQAIIKACLTRDPAARPTATELLELDYFREKLPEEVIQVWGTPQKDDPSVVDLRIMISKPGLSKTDVKFPFDTVSDTVREVVTEMVDSEAVKLVGEEGEALVRVIEEALSDISPSLTASCSNQMKLVRVSSSNGLPETAVVAVCIPDPEKPREIKVNLHGLTDRRDLLFDVLKVVYDLPLQVMSAVYSTEKGTVIDDFQLLANEDWEVDLDLIQARLSAVL